MTVSRAWNDPVTIQHGALASPRDGKALHFMASLSTCTSWFRAASCGGMFVSVTMGKRNRSCFSLFVYCQNTGTRLSVDVSCSYITVLRFNNSRSESERHTGTRWANKELYILPHRGIFQGFLFDNASASCYSFKCQRAVLYVLYTFFLKMQSIYVYNTGLGNRAVKFSGLWRI